MQRRTTSRREFLGASGRLLGASWLVASLPAIQTLAACARQAAEEGLPFQFLTPEEAVELDALAALIIPSDETPGAREAGAVHFIDLMLKDEPPEDVQIFRGGLQAFQQRVRKDHPQVERFSQLEPAEQIAFLQALDAETQAGEEAAKAAAIEQVAEEAGAEGAAVIEEARIVEPTAEIRFFDNVRVATITGTVCHPNQGGNNDLVGWAILGLDPSMTFQPPFGYYDRLYAEQTEP